MIKRPIRQKTDAFGINVFIWLIALSGQILSVINHRLFWRICNVLSKIMPQGQYRCEVALDSDSVMKIYLDDPYWSQLVAASYEYESEILHTLRMLRHIPYVFVDCGANFGYWSIVLSSARMGNHKGVAIEASPVNFAILQENRALNNNRFDCMNLAVSDIAGREVAIDTSSSHADHKIAADRLPEHATGARTIHEVVQKREEHLVITTTLDNIVREHLSELPDYLLVKLDVEGEEINAFKGALSLLSQDVLFCYEDHGKDPESRVTQYVLEELGLSVLLRTNDGRVIRLHTAEEATQFKTRESYGYNFLACKEKSRFIKALSLS